MDMNLLILLMAIKFYFVYGLVSAILGFWCARDILQKAAQQRRDDGKKHIFAFFVAAFFASVFIWPYILCAAIKQSLTRKSENNK